jgi:hypothetical protein
MWHIKNPEIRKATLDFTSSDQGKPEVSQLIYDNSILMNAIEYIDFDEDAVQIIVCDHCGITQCSSGNWVCFRKSGKYILLMPTFKEIEEDSWNMTEYASPTFKDTPYFDLKTYESLRKQITNLPNPKQIKSLKMSEAMRLVHCNFPFRFFGEPPTIFIQPNKWNLAVGASEGEVKEHLETIENILKENYENNSPALIRKPLPNEKIIHIFLDANEFIDWQAIVENKEKYLLTLEDHVIELNN